MSNLKFSLDLVDLEKQSNLARELTLAYLYAHGYLSKDELTTLLTETMLVCRTKNCLTEWLQKTFNTTNDSDRSVTYKMVTLDSSVLSKNGGRKDISSVMGKSNPEGEENSNGKEK